MQQRGYGLNSQVKYTKNWNAVIPYSYLIIIYILSMNAIECRGRGFKSTFKMLEHLD